MMLKDNNFISAVVYLHNDGARAVEFCRTVAAELDANFKQYELVVVDDACTDDTVKQLRAWGGEQDAPLTILHMSIYHGLEDAMNAGLDAAIGDYVYEFDSTELCYAPTLIMQAYRAALDGSDIVSVCPRTVRGGSNRMRTVTGAGCMLSVLCGAFAAVQPGDAFTAAVQAARFWKACAEQAENHAAGAGSFRVALFDAAGNMTDEVFAGE